MSKNNILSNMIIESQYWGSIDYFRLLLKCETVYIEHYEHFVKASYRNRCQIATPDGIQILTVPIESGRGVRKILKDVKIHYSTDWQKHHWQSLCSAYRRSPYFEYYEDDLQPLFTNKFKFLLDLNNAAFEKINTFLDLEINLKATDTFEKTYEEMDDKRSCILPSKSRNKNPYLDDPVTYHQVFESKCPFLPNMSILDLLFAEGPNAKMKIIPQP